MPGVRVLVAVLLSLGLCGVASAAPPGHWESRPAAPLPRQEAAFAALDGKLHLVGGFEYGLPDSARHEVYDLATQAWSPAVPLPEPSHHVNAVALGGKLYVVGGAQTANFVVTGRMWAYDPASGVWEARASLPAGRARTAGAAVAHDGRLLYVGGLTSGSTATGLVDLYDPASDTWVALPDMPTPRDHLGAAVVGRTLYAVGGRRAAFETEVAVTEALDLTTFEWRSGLAPIPTLRAGFATAAVDGEIVTVGGESAAGVHENVEAYDPASDSWRALAPMPLPRHGIQGVSHASGVWVAGGGTDLLVGATGDLDVLFPGPRPAAPAPAPAPPAAPPAPAAQSPQKLTLSAPRRVRRGTRRITVRISADPRARVTITLGRRARAIVDATPTARRVVRQLRRGLPRGRHTVTARAGTATARRTVTVR